jgi:preprotein translocase SecE subunit
MSIGQYLKDTRAELRHVAWPTQLQTILYTTLVVFVSIAVALYLGLFDFLFTTGLARFVAIWNGAAPTEQVVEQPDVSVEVSTSTAQ